MIPNTINGLNPHECISAMHKFCRRGMEREAMEMAVEMARTSKAFASWVAGRLEIISYEDVGLAAPEVIPLVRTCCLQAREWYSDEDLGKWGMPIGTAIRALCRAPKSREGDHFQAAVLLRSELESYVPEMPDWVLDHHTRRGKAQKRGMEYFRDVSTQLNPEPEADPYRDDAYRMWFLKESGATTKQPAAKGKHQTRELF